MTSENKNQSNNVAITEYNDRLFAETTTKNEKPADLVNVQQKDQLLIACLMGDLTQVRKLLENGFVLSAPIRVKCLQLAKQNNHEAVMQYLYNFKQPLTKNVSISPDNYVIVRAWLPTNYGQRVSYLEAVLRRTFTPSNKHAHIGHLAFYIHHGDREQYISFFPTESHPFTPSPAINHTLLQDIQEQENLPPTMQSILFSLDTQKMLTAFDAMQGHARWFLTGNRFVYNPTQDEIYNCSSYVNKLLTLGGMYNHLLLPKQQLQDPMLPQEVCQLAERASQVEKILYPETKEALKKYLDQFGQELLTRSQDKEDPVNVIDRYLKDNPDFYLRVNAYDKNYLDQVLPGVYRNIQKSLNEKLTQAKSNETKASYYNGRLFKASEETTLADVDKPQDAKRPGECRDLGDMSDPKAPESPKLN